MLEQLEGSGSKSEKLIGIGHHDIFVLALEEMIVLLPQAVKLGGGDILCRCHALQQVRPQRAYCQMKVVRHQAPGKICQRGMFEDFFQASQDCHLGTVGAKQMRPVIVAVYDVIKFPFGLQSRLAIPILTIRSFFVIRSQLFFRKQFRDP